MRYGSAFDQGCLSFFLTTVQHYSIEKRRYYGLRAKNEKHIAILLSVNEQDNDAFFEFIFCRVARL
jgi:hypothetical protein